MTYSSLKGKVAIVTGGASGIGAATAKRLASYGVILALADVNGSDLDKVAKECAEISEKFNISKPLVFVGDLSCGTTREEFVKETIATFGKLDILANVAGICTPTSIFDKTMENAEKLFSILLIPGAIKTNLVATPPGQQNHFDEAANMYTTMKRAGEPDEIAKVIAFMISDENLYMNGSDVLVDGGFLVKKRDIPKCA
ncbi:hypothetical protein CHUAL_002345 [Chamberlinius hualienensis]